MDSTVGLAAVPIIQLEALRLRLTQLVHSLNTLQNQVQHSSLPSWPALQQQFSIILTQLMSLSSTLSGFAENLQRTVAYPLGNFPTQQESGLLTTLLRKKNQPAVAQWIQQGQNSAQGIKIKQDEDFCHWARELVSQEISQHEWLGFLTKTQINEGDTDTGAQQNANTGGGGGGGPETGGAEPAGFSLDDIITYMSTGEVPQSASGVDRGSLNSVAATTPV